MRSVMRMYSSSRANPGRESANDSSSSIDHSCNAVTAISARSSGAEGKYSYTLLRANPARLPTAAGVTAAGPFRRSSSRAAATRADRWRERCSATVGALMRGIL